MENAEVLEMTVRRVESILQNQAQGKQYTTRHICLLTKNDLPAAAYLVLSCHSFAEHWRHLTRPTN